MVCPAENRLNEFAAGALSTTSRDAVEAHIDDCAACRRVLSMLADLAAASGSGADTVPVAPVVATGPLPRGTMVGRYVVLDVLGAGGMGIVYRAYDPDLGRKVALKLVRPDRHGDGSAPEARSRQLREAQAMARLSHPHVIAIHDVGTHAGAVFLAMELIEGTTLAEWMRDRRRPRREVLATFAAAGRGLAAAHASGLVHRDFKPHNVLVGDDGRVCVTDFGLARNTGLREATPVAPLEETEPAGGHLLESPLTTDARVAGTPAYMAPEQYRGAAVDARTDQFAYCIALWEALEGERPFAGATVADLQREVCNGRLREPRHALPTFLRKALVRGLDPDPARRWPSMGALLDALAADPRRIWRRVGIAAGALAVAIGAALAWGDAEADRARTATAAAQVCKGLDRGLAGVWDPARKTEVQRALLGTGKPFAAETWQRVETRLDEYAARWVTTRVRACQDTRITKTHSETVLAARERCLDQRRTDLGALVGLLARADTETLTRAVSATSVLEAPSTCIDLEAGRVGPWDPSVAARASVLWTRLASARMLNETGKYQAAATEARAGLPDARAFGYTPLVGALERQLGVALGQLGELDGAKQAFTAAAAEAEKSRDDEQRIGALMDLGYILNQDPANAEELKRWRVIIEGLRARLDSNAELRCDVASQLTGVTDAHADDAMSVAQDAVRLCSEPMVGAADDRLVVALNNLAIAQMARGKLTEPREALERGIALSARVEGPDHPGAALMHANVAKLYLATYDHDAASQHLQRALTIIEANALENLDLETAVAGFTLLHASRGEAVQALAWARRGAQLAERLYGTESAGHAAAMIDEADALLGLDRLDDAYATAKRAREIIVARLGADHPSLVDADYSLAGIIYYRRGPAAALQRMQSIVARVKQAYPDEPIWHVQYLADLAQLRHETGASEESLALYREVLALMKKAWGDNPDLSVPLSGMGRVLVDTGRSLEAIEPLERATQLIAGHVLEPAFVASIQFDLARALWDSGRDRRRALELARTALAGYQRTTNPDRRDGPGVARWLRGKRAP